MTTFYHCHSSDTLGAIGSFSYITNVHLICNYQRSFPRLQATFIHSHTLSCWVSPCTANTLVPAIHIADYQHSFLRSLPTPSFPPLFLRFTNTFHSSSTASLPRPSCHSPTFLTTPITNTPLLFRCQHPSL